MPAGTAAAITTTLHTRSRFRTSTSVPTTASNRRTGALVGREPLSPSSIGAEPIFAGGSAKRMNGASLVGATVPVNGTK